MKRRSFLQTLAGLALTPFLPKPDPRPPLTYNRFRKLERELFPPKPDPYPPHVCKQLLELQQMIEVELWKTRSGRN